MHPSVSGRGFTATFISREMGARVRGAEAPRSLREAGRAGSVRDREENAPAGRGLMGLRAEAKARLLFGVVAAWVILCPFKTSEEQPQILRLAALAQDDSAGLGLCDPTLAAESAARIDGIRRKASAKIE